MQATPEVDLNCPVQERAVCFEAADGYPLSGLLYSTPDSGNARHVAVFNCGGGIAAARYRHFLTFLASTGIPTLAFDYRGVGGSAPTDRRKFDAGIEDWAERDQPAAVALVRERFPMAAVTSISHSIGALIATASPNASSLENLVLIAPHTGYWGDYRQPWRLPMAVFWHLLMPVTAYCLGYFPARILRVGDDFPRRLAFQWSARTHAHFKYGAYGGNAAGEYRAVDNMSMVTGVALVLSAHDDAFATDRAIRRFLMGVPSLQSVRREIGSEEGTRIGHWGFFQRRNAAYWAIVSDFILRSSPRVAIDPEWSAEQQD